MNYIGIEGFDDARIPLSEVKPGHVITIKGAIKATVSHPPKHTEQGFIWAIIPTYGQKLINIEDITNW